MIKTITVEHFTEDAFNEDLSETLNNIKAAGGKVLNIANNTHAQQKDNGWGSLIASFWTVWTAVVVYEIDG